MEEITKFGANAQKYKSIDDLSAAVGHFMSNSMSPATRSAYKTDLKQYLEFCHRYKLNPLPASEDTVCKFIASMALEGMAVATIQRKMTTINQLHFAHKETSPTGSYRVTQCLLGIKKELGTGQKKAKALMLADLRKICKKAKPNIIGVRDKAMLLLGWACAMRRSELVALDFEDVQIIDEGLVVTIRRSKTDQTGEGYKLGIPHGQDPSFCPVAAYSDFIRRSKIKSGPLFFAMGANGTKFAVPVEAERHRLNPRSVNALLARRLRDAGIDPTGYSGHSLRAGYITEAAKQKIPGYLIQKHTRHSSQETMKGYIRDADLFNENPLSLLI